MCDDCRNLKDGPFCVAGCPIAKFADDNKLCQPCHANCVGGCNGSANTVGPNGCNSCHVSIANEAEDGIVKCLNETESCPSGYFASRNPPTALSHLKGSTVSCCLHLVVTLSSRICKSFPSQTQEARHVVTNGSYCYECYVFNLPCFVPQFPSSFMTEKEET